MHYRMNLYADSRTYKQTLMSRTNKGPDHFILPMTRQTIDCFRIITRREQELRDTSKKCILDQYAHIALKDENI